MTVWEYVRAEFWRLGRYIAGMMVLSAPIFLAIRIKDHGFSWALVAAAAGGLAFACALACIALLLILPVAGWWKLHMKLSPYVPVTILMVAAVLGCYWVMHYY